MDSTSPDNEKNFPGLFGGGLKSSKMGVDISSDESPRKDSLLLGKKDTKKDKGYAALEGDISPSEDPETRSPFKGKKKSFKFPSKKDKRSKEEAKSTLDRKSDLLKALKEEEEREKERKQKLKEAKRAEKELKKKQEKIQSKEKLDTADLKKGDKGSKMDKKEEKKPERKENKLKDKPEKSSQRRSSKDKLCKKDKTKKKDCIDLFDETIFPVFGIPLHISYERSKCHDGLELPLIVRECVDVIEENGLTIEGIYRSSGIKTKVAELRKSYNLRLPSKINEYDMPTIASVLKQYFRELPDSLLTQTLEESFECAALLKDEAEQHRQLRLLIEKLPGVNKAVLAWLFVHMSHVIQNEKINKMNAKNLCLVLHPTLNFSHRLIACFISNGGILFEGVQLKRYIPPLSGLGGKALTIPEYLEEIDEEIKKQESFLAEIHSELSVGIIWKHREEQLWEAQRIVTQLKRKLKTLTKQRDNPDNSITLSTTPSQIDGVEVRSLSSEVQEDSSKSLPEDLDDNLRDNDINDENVHLVEEEEESEVVKFTNKGREEDSVFTEEKTDKDISRDLSLEEEEDELSEEEYQEMILKELMGRIEVEVREEAVVDLRRRMLDLNETIGHLQEQLSEFRALHSSENSDASVDEDELDPELEERDQKILAEILRENRELEEINEGILQRIIQEQENCILAKMKLRFEAEKQFLVVA